MVASELISYDIPPLKLTDTGAKALDWMEEFKTSELPVVDKGIYIGLISESVILDKNKIDKDIASYDFTFNKPFATKSQHLFEVISLIVQNDINVLPVVDEKENYIGLITTKRILQYLAQAVSVANVGSILTLELNINDYSLAEVSKLVESEDAKILTSFITSHPESKKLELTLKINKTEISRILNAFERHNYTVVASYNESEYHKDLQNRYDEFMRFLNI
jgi:acetoin utilization protein AcuB